MKTQKMFRRWQERRATLLAHLPELLRLSRADGGREHIHQLRVTLRRLWLLTRLGRKLFDNPAAVRTLQTWWGLLSQRTSRLRDYDVALEWVEKQPASALLVERLLARRNRIWRALKNKLIPLPARLITQLQAVQGGRKQQVRLRKRYFQQLKQLKAEILAGIPGFFELPLVAQHDFRRLLRRWRYLQELGLARRDLARDPLLKQLVRVQDAIGQHRNLTLAGEILAHQKASVLLERLQRLLVKEQNVMLVEIRRGFKALSRRFALAGADMTRSDTK